MKCVVMIGSPEVNKILRRQMSPILRAHGFQKVGPRKSWSFHNPCIWVVSIRSVGSYFSDVTGWPPMSITASVGIFYDFVPFFQTIKQDSVGRLLPEEYQCELGFRSVLTRAIDQNNLTRNLTNPAERVREDIWWIQRDGSNVEEVVLDLASSFVAQAIPWFEKLSDLTNAFVEIESERDCYTKYQKATHFAKQLNLKDKYCHYSKLLEAETERLRSRGFLR